KDFNATKEKFDFLNIRESKDVEKNIKTLEAAGGKLVQSLGLIYSFRVGKWKALIVAVLFAFASFLLIKYVDFFRQQFDQVKYLVIGLAAVLSQVIAFIK